MADTWKISRQVRGDEVQFTVRWSPWGSLDKWVINRIVPSEAGLFQLWVMQGSGLVLLTTEPTYYGGLRNSLREVIDEMAPSGDRLRQLIGDRETWFRYSTTPIREHLELLKAWFAGGEEIVDDDKREVVTNEVETYRKFPLPPPDVKIIGRERMKDSEFGPNLPTPDQA